MTYKQAWEWYFKPTLDQQKEWRESRPESGAAFKRSSDGREVYAGHRGFDVTKATKQEMDDLLDKMCGDRVYEGVKFWIPEEAAKHGIKTYTGKDN